ncbi:MAG: CPBP family intramembrane metalloprotease [Spirulina sp. SIO3F2]|nr:CPBP family intramembrane metalloprotease [Spirulina sp. SIO3F2]
MHRLQQRLYRSLRIPTRQDWRQTLIVLVVYGAIALPIAIHFQLFTWSPWPAAQFWSGSGLKLILGTLFLPALAEEIIFRVLLLPHPSETIRLRIVLLWIGMSLGLFMVYHPLNALTLFPHGNPTFFQPVFLSLAGLLGFACTMLYRQTGSLWTIVLVHWFVVVIWLGLGAGAALLNWAN